VSLSTALKDIIISKTKWIHFFFFLLIEVLVAALLYILIIPIVFWSIFGEGASSDRIGSLPLSIFIGEWGSLIIVLIICIVSFFKNVRRRDLRNAKSYLLIALIVTGLYLFRAQLFNIPFEI
jgi:hypothetical protein